VGNTVELNIRLSSDECADLISTLYAGEQAPDPEM